MTRRKDEMLSNEAFHQIGTLRHDLCVLLYSPKGPKTVSCHVQGLERVDKKCNLLDVKLQLACCAIPSTAIRQNRSWYCDAESSEKNNEQENVFIWSPGELAPFIRACIRNLGGKIWRFKGSSNFEAKILKWISCRVYKATVSLIYKATLSLQ